MEYPLVAAELIRLNLSALHVLSIAVFSFALNAV
jgi:hypothetical protein